MRNSSFRINCVSDDGDITYDLDIRKELKRRLNLNIIDGALFDEIINAFTKNLPVYDIFIEKFYTK